MNTIVVKCPKCGELYDYDEWGKYIDCVVCHLAFVKLDFTTDEVLPKCSNTTDEVLPK